MHLKKLGKSDLTVSSYCLGTMTFGETTEESIAHKQISECFEKGINFIDIVGCGGRIWTYDLQVMSLTSYRAAPPRVNLCGSLFVSFPWFEVTTFKSMYHSLIWPGSDLLSHALRRSTIGAEGFHDRVRDGIGCRPLAITTRPDERMVTTFNRD